MLVDTNAELNLSGDTFRSNQAANGNNSASGGAIANLGTVNLYSGDAFVNNIAQAYGGTIANRGALYVLGNGVTAVNFSGNSEGQGGGPVYNSSSAVSNYSSSTGGTGTGGTGTGTGSTTSGPSTGTASGFGALVGSIGSTGGGVMYTSGGGVVGTTGGGGGVIGTTGGSGGGVGGMGGGGVGGTGGGAEAVAPTVRTNSSAPSTTTSVTDSGTSSDQYSYQLAITGTYSNGVFTITSESYNETGSYNFSWKATWNSSSLDGSSTSNQDMSSSGNYMLSWDAAPDDNGQLVFTAYSYSATAKSTWDINSSGSDGSYVEDDFGTSGSIDMTGSGTTASSTGTITTDTYLHSYTPLPDGSSIDTTYEDEETNPVSGTADLSSLLVQSTSGWQWEAGASNAVNYNFHGVSSETANLTETSTYQVTNSGTTFVVNAFNSSSQTADSSHVVDDEPETPASSGGSDSFHRDEAYSNSDNVTGSGSYGGGQTNATFQAVQVATYNVADSLTDNNETVTGTDANGNTYTTNYNYGGQVNGSGTFTTTDNYQDVSNGLALSSETLQSSGTGQNSYQYSGTTNGQAFDDCGSTPESFNDPAETFQGSPAPCYQPRRLRERLPVPGHG